MVKVNVTEISHLFVVEVIEQLSALTIAAPFDWPFILQVKQST